MKVLCKNLVSWKLHKITESDPRERLLAIEDAESEMSVCWQGFQWWDWVNFG